MQPISSYAASWRDEHGGIVASVYGDTICLSPVDARNLAAISADGNYESTLPCRKCEGCRRYQMLVLRRRLVEGFKSCREKLWTLQVDCSPSVRQWVIRTLRRTMMRTEWLGYCISKDGFVALIAKATQPRLSAWITGPTRLYRAKPVKARARLSGWRKLTVGLLIPREVYGEQVNRFYFRGLAPYQREPLEVQTKGGIRKRHPDARAGVRAWRNGLSLYPSQRCLVREFLSRLRNSCARASATLTINRPRALARVSESGSALKLVLQRALPMRQRSLGKPVRHKDAPTGATDAPERTPLSFKGGRDASSDIPLPRDLAEWVLKMTHKARTRGDP